MFGIGWQELFVIGLITLLLVGPAEMPRVLRAVTAGIRKMRGIAGEFQAGIDEMVRQADIEDIQKQIGQSVDPEEEMRRMIDPGGDTETALRNLADYPEDSPGNSSETFAGKSLDENPSALDEDPEPSGDRREKGAGDR